MRFVSTRNSRISVDTKEAVLTGLAKDGGLYIPYTIPKFDDLFALASLSYIDLAYKIMRKLFDDIDRDHIHSALVGAYEKNFSHEDVTPLRKVGDNYFLELFHGPTSAFKDVALAFLPRLMTVCEIESGETRPVAIATATSGDTGKAALEGFKDVENTFIKVLYPYQMVSKVQEKQMTTTGGKNTEVLAVKGNFDDCQELVKELLENYDFPALSLTSANSINIGRLVPQVVYYFKAYFDLYKHGQIQRNEKVNFVVPTGNFGDILAGYIAKCMGLPVEKLICASNENDVLTVFLNTGVYDANRPLINTIAPSIDILVSSNLERLLYLKCMDSDKVAGWMKELKENRRYEIDSELLADIQKDFVGISTNESEMKAAIRQVYESEHYLMDTHTCVAYIASKKFNNGYTNVILSTASPFKFSKAVYDAITGEESADDLDSMERLSQLTGMEIPKNLSELKTLPVRFTEVIEKTDIRVLKEKMEKING